MVSIRAALAQAPAMLDDVARSLGAGRCRTCARVTLPLIAPGWALARRSSSSPSSTELTATLLLAPIGTETLATQFWSNASSIAYGAAAPYAALMVADLRPRDLPAHPRARTT